MELLLQLLITLVVLFVLARLGSMIVTRFGLPGLIGEIVMGIVIANIAFGDGWSLMEDLLAIEMPDPVAGTEGSTVYQVVYAFAELGVIFLLFTVGLETKVKDLMNSGRPALLCAILGVIVPFVLGFALIMAWPNTAIGGGDMNHALFLAAAMVATSVGITARIIKDLKLMDTKEARIIIAAAVIDDVLGLIVLTVALSLNSAPSDVSGVLALINPAGSPVISIAWMFAFFVVAIGCGILIIKLFKRLERKHPHTRRIPILSLVVCLLYAFVAERVFGVAEITGAYIAGVILSVNHASAEYVDRRVTINSYMIFAPIFFANIGIKIDFSGLSLHVLWFTLAFVATAIAGKIIGCGGVAKCCGFSWKDSVKIGVGMIARGEVALIVMEKGIAGGLLGPEYRVIVVMLVLISSVLAPVLLKMLFKHDDPLTGGWKEVPFTPSAAQGDTKTGAPDAALTE